MHETRSQKLKGLVLFGARTHGTRTGGAFWFFLKITQQLLTSFRRTGRLLWLVKAKRGTQRKRLKIKGSRGMGGLVAVRSPACCVVCMKVTPKWGIIYGGISEINKIWRKKIDGRVADESWFLLLTKFYDIIKHGFPYSKLASFILWVCLWVLGPLSRACLWLWFTKIGWKEQVLLILGCFCSQHLKTFDYAIGREKLWWKQFGEVHYYAAFFVLLKWMKGLSLWHCQGH